MSEEENSSEISDCEFGEEDEDEQLASVEEDLEEGEEEGEKKSGEKEQQKSDKSDASGSSQSDSRSSSGKSEDEGDENTGATKSTTTNERSERQQDDDEDDESQEVKDDKSENKSALANSQSVGSINDVEACLVTQVAKRWSVYKEEARVYEVVKIAKGVAKKGGLFGRSKTDEGEERIMVIGRYHIWLFSRAIKKKVTELAEIHIFGLKSVKYDETSHRLILETKVPLDKPIALDFYCGVDTKLFLGLVESYYAMTIGFPDDYIDILCANGSLPPRKETTASDFEAFVDNYIGQCCYMRLPICREILLYVEHQFKVGNNVLDLTSIPAITSNTEEKVPSVPFSALLAALSYDKHFRSIVVSRSPFSVTLKTLGDVVSRNTFITKLIATQVSATDAELCDFFTGLAKNTMTNLQIIDLSGNTFGPKSAAALGTWLSSSQRLLNSLILRECGLTGRLVQIILDALSSNPVMSLNIQTIDLSFNKLDQQGGQALDSWFNQLKAYAHLKRLLIRNTGIVPSMLPNLRLLTEVEEVDFSQNRIDSQSMSVFCQFLDVTPSLSKVSMDACALTQDVFNMFADSILGNLKGIVLDLSITENPELGKMFGKDISKFSKHLSAINLSGYRMREQQLVDVISGLAEVSGIKSVVLHSTSDGKAKSHEPVAKALCDLIATGTLEELDISDGFGPGVITALFGNKKEPNATVNDTVVDCAVSPEYCSLHKLNISGNMIGDCGARFVAEWLEHNTALESLRMDDNHLKINGFLVLSTALVANKSLSELIVDADFNREYSLMTTERERRRLLDVMLRIDLSLHGRESSKREHWICFTNSTVATIPAPEDDGVLPLPPTIFQGRSSESQEPAEDTSEPSKARMERDLAEAEKKMRLAHRPVIASRVRGSSNASSPSGSAPATPVKEPPKLSAPPVLSVPARKRSKSPATPKSPANTQTQPQQQQPSPASSSQRRPNITARRAAPTRRTAPTGPSLGPQGHVPRVTVKSADEATPFSPTNSVKVKPKKAEEKEKSEKPKEEAEKVEEKESVPEEKKKVEEKPEVKKKVEEKPELKKKVEEKPELKNAEEKPEVKKKVEEKPELKKKAEEKPEEKKVEEKPEEKKKVEEKPEVKKEEKPEKEEKEPEEKKEEEPEDGNSEKKHKHKHKHKKDGEEKKEHKHKHKKHKKDDGEEDDS